MTTKFLKTSLVSALSVTLLSFSASSWGNSFIDTLIQTTPVGLSNNQKASWQSLVEGTKTLFNEGNNLLILPVRTEHPRWAWDNRRQQNGWPFGMGLGRQLVDDQQNERTLFLINFVDSNYRAEPMVGYQWLKRFPVGQSGFHVGAGYLAGLSMRGDYRWIPFPMVLPVAKVGYENLSAYMTYIPVTDVFFFYTTFSFDDKASRDKPLPVTSAWASKQNYLYGGIGWEYIDESNTEETTTWASNNDSWHVGLRHYSGRHWATDLSWRESKHLVRTPTRRDTYRFRSLSLQLQYNIDVTHDLRVYAGGGFGYSEMKGQCLKDHSLHPVTSIGATYALTRDIFVNADMHVSFSRFKDNVKGSQDQYFKAMPTDFTVSLGYAF